MKRVREKLRNNHGETLVELLASILIASLSVGLLLGGVAVSVNLNREADQADEYFYETLTAAESRAESATEGVAPVPEVEVKEGVTTAKIPVRVYGDEGLYAYALNTVGGTGP